MSTELASATSRAQVGRGLLLVAAGLLAIACGGEATNSRGNTHDGGSGGESPVPGDGGAPSSGGAPSTGGETGSGGEQIGGGGGLIDNGCNLDTIECVAATAQVHGGCSCEGVFDSCPTNQVYCEANAEGEAYNCVCGPAPVLVTDCEYSLQYRCEPLAIPDWVRTCTCDPVYPTDEEPCRYYQAMYDEAGENRICTMSVADIEPTEEWKYYCSCLVPEDG
jgi:hypothetical protein